jgi:hypothetical protein
VINIAPSQVTRHCVLRALIEPAVFQSVTGG